MIGPGYGNILRKYCLLSTSSFQPLQNPFRDSRVVSCMSGLCSGKREKRAFTHGKLMLIDVVASFADLKGAWVHQPNCNPTPLYKLTNSTCSKQTFSKHTKSANSMTDIDFKGQ